MDKVTEAAAPTAIEGKISGAISCKITGFSAADSLLYINGGGKDFKETVPNNFCAHG